MHHSMHLIVHFQFGIAFRFFVALLLSLSLSLLFFTLNHKPPPEKLTTDTEQRVLYRRCAALFSGISAFVFVYFSFSCSIIASTTTGLTGFYFHSSLVVILCFYCQQIFLLLMLSSSLLLLFIVLDRVIVNLYMCVLVCMCFQLNLVNLVSLWTYYNCSLSFENKI